MAETTPTNGFSPLDQIRLAEAEITRKILTAREVSEHTIAEARAQAVILKKQALESGTKEGQIQYKEIVSKAEEEARAIVEHAHNQATAIRWRGESRMEAAIQETTNIILGLKGGGKSNES